MPEELWTEVHDIVQEAVIKTTPMEKKCGKAKWLSEEALQIAVKRSSFIINHWYCPLGTLTTPKMNLYCYTVEMTNRFKGLDLIEYLKNYVTLYRRQ